MIKAIFFDLDDTLLDFGKAEKAAVTKAFRQVGLEPDEAFIREYCQINEALWKQMEQGEITRDALLVERFNILFRRHGLAISGQEAEDHYRGFLGIGHYFVDGAEDILAYLAPKYPLYLASNGVADTQYSRLKSAGIGPFFKALFISETTGFHKPERGYFDYCFRAIGGGLKPEQTLMIGDSLSSDIRGGRDAGMLTCWFNPKALQCPPELQPDYEIRHLSELKQFL